EYPLADVTYRELLDELANNNFTTVDDGLRDSILQFYEGYTFPKQDARLDKCVIERWRKTWVELARLRATEILDAPVAQATREAAVRSGSSRHRGTIRPD